MVASCHGSAPAALGPVVGVLPDRGQLAVRVRHKPFEHIVKRGAAAVCRGAAAVALLDIVPPGLLGTVIAVLAAAPALPLGRLRALLDRQVDLSVFHGDNLRLDCLSDGQMVVDVADIAVGHLRNVNHSGFPILQGYKCTEFCDSGDFSFTLIFKSDY